MSTPDPTTATDEESVESAAAETLGEEVGIPVPDGSDERPDGEV